ncbi:hypothetical protein [Actinacidiphila sp. ITFR-21]|uniref:hypothetical protein n=1 Tax=Actinacidiphila sp. ITFR-21 TaxID=3075199 RepID=UPI00288BF042|nr:hypothetical protein [Streptomyces sp. ITFR-21]WNI16639.1 hypothetical protein RLT57_14705 [Streptomyces sp. ITFR-21]
MTHAPAQLDTITQSLTSLIPGGVRANMQIVVTEQQPQGPSHTWTGTVDGLALRLSTALTDPGAAAGSPLARAEDAKRRRDLAGEIGALMDGGAQLEAAPWYPARPGDIVHITYGAVGPYPAYGETYVIEAADAEPFLSMRLLHHSPNLPVEILATTGCYAVDEDTDPLMEPWFEAGAEHITLVRDGAVIPHQAPGR